MPLFLKYFTHRFGIVSFLLCHFFLSWIFLSLAGEKSLTLLANYPYFYVSTGTTIGYGDFVPHTVLGRNIAAFFIMPGGMILMASFFAKIVNMSVNFKQRYNQGQGTYRTMTSHFVLLGWNDKMTLDVIKQIKSEYPNQKIVLYASHSDLKTNPFPDLVEFVRGNGAYPIEDVKATGLVKAQKIITLGHDDENTLSLAFMASSLLPKKRRNDIKSYFHNAQYAQLLKLQYPETEIVVSLSTQLLTRSLEGRQTYELFKELMDGTFGATQRILTVKDPLGGLISYDSLAIALIHSDINATLVGIRKRTEQRFLLSPGDGGKLLLEEGDILAYISDCSLDSASLARLVDMPFRK